MTCGLFSMVCRNISKARREMFEGSVSFAFFLKLSVIISGF